MENTTIVAPATALVNQAISIIRLSGKNAYNIINKIFNKKINKPKKNEIIYGFIKDNNNDTIDEVLLMCFKSPYSFTGEDMIEINCHGGIFITKKIIDLLIKNGATLAKKGEFSKRAFLNGKINLLQAESINNLVFSNNDTSSKIAINTILGKNFTPIIEIRKIILNIIANIEVNIDYPEYDGIGDLTLNELEIIIKDLINKTNKIINLSKLGKIVNDGVNTAIIGKPNVGKSSFLNVLLNENRAIVSNIEGTTRDLIEANINLGFITLNLIDTAGIRKTNNIIEKQGIEKSKEAIKKSDLIILILDSSKKISDEDIELIELTKNTKRIILKNKIDIISNKFKIEELNLSSEEIKNIINISTIKNNIKNFIKNIEKLFSNVELSKKENLVLVNIHHINILEKIYKKLKLIYDKINKEFPVDIISINLKEIWDLLGKLLGEEYEENILDTIFNNYCLGK